MYHSITIGDKNTWDDWHLIPASRPLVSPPAVKTHMIDIPGGDGQLDLSEALAGRPIFGNRSGTWTFYVENGFRNWASLYSEIMAYLHGRTMRVTLEDDPGYYYEGRLSVNQWRSDAEWSQIVIDYNFAPYKMSIDSTGADWLWDPFDFKTGVIRNTKNMTVSGSRTVTLEGDMKPVSPTIWCSTSGMSVSYDGTTYALSQGTNQVREIVLRKGDNTLVLYGNGIVTIENAGGRL